MVRMRRMLGGESVLDMTPFAVADSIDAARESIQNTDCLICLPRGVEDSPDVVETWI